MVYLKGGLRDRVYTFGKELGTENSHFSCVQHISLEDLAISSVIIVQCAPARQYSTPAKPFTQLPFKWYWFFILGEFMLLQLLRDVALNHRKLLVRDTRACCGMHKMARVWDYYNIQSDIEEEDEASHRLVMRRWRYKLYFTAQIIENNQYLCKSGPT